jgi:response regulator RpfG family c-di-GMP phosphodiesterase
VIGRTFQLRSMNLMIETWSAYSCSPAGRSGKPEPLAANRRIYGCFSQFMVHRFPARMWCRKGVRCHEDSRSRKMPEAPKKVLCIADDRQTAKLIAEDLTERGFEVIIAYNGHEGFIAILKGLPDLVLCDVGLPHMTGFEVLKRLNRLSPRLKHIPFLFLTALSDRDSERRGRNLGAADYITKPIDFDILEATVNARLAARNEAWPKLVTLSDREAEALTWVARGKTSAQIADMFDLPKQAVDSHLDNARAKLGASRRAER